VCGFSYASSGTVLTSQTEGDCKEKQCDGSGSIIDVNADVDVPVDGAECTNDVCTSGVPSNPPKMSGASCSGGGVCDGAGVCVQCLTKNDCPGTDTECSVRTCTANVCGLSNTSAGTATSMQTAGDCKENQCDGSGSVVSVNVSGDVTDDGNECTSDICTAGVASHPFKAAGTSCSGGTGACDGAGVCEPFTVWIARVGDGVATLSPAAAPAFIDKLDINATTLAPTLTRNVVALPTAVSGPNRRLTVSGSGPSEGSLLRSADERYVTIGGYDADVGTASVSGTTSSATNRVVGRIDAALVVDTTTTVSNMISGNAPRAVVSSDGTKFWISGGTTGTVYVPLGGTTGTSLVASPTSNRWINIAGGQLYASAASGTFTGVFSVGTGLPTSSGQTATMLPGMSTTSAYGFMLFDRSSTVTGVDTLYVADDGSPTTGVGGIQKWTFDGSTWTKIATFNTYITATGTTASQSYRGVTGRVIDGKVYLVAMASALTVLYVDDGTTPTAGKLMATAAANTQFRGVALAPHN
jgi:hypothetical protein